MKKMNKSAVSIMISYVLLISIAIALSIGVFSWLKIMANVEPPADCEEETSIIIEDYSCDFQAQSSNLKLDIKNNGRFNIDGIIVIVGEDAERNPSTYLLPDIIGGTLRGHYYFINPLKPGETSTIGFLNKIDSDTTTDIQTMRKIEIQPFIIAGKERVICQNAVKKQSTTDCKIT